MVIKLFLIFKIKSKCLVDIISVGRISGKSGYSL